MAQLGYDGVQTLDMAGPLDGFAAASSLHEGAYETLVVSQTGAPFSSAAGLRILLVCALAEAGALDTLILPGGEGLRRRGVAVAVARAITQRAPILRRFVSICTGLYGLAPSGLADGRRPTTHWKFAGRPGGNVPGDQAGTGRNLHQGRAGLHSAGITFTGCGKIRA